MNPQDKTYIDAQLKEINDNAKKAENRNGKITIFALGLAGLLALGNVAQGIAIKGLTPLKQPVPMIAVLDSQTGIMTEKQKYDSTTSPEMVNKLVTSYFWNAIKNRYGYNGRIGADSLKEQYQSVSIFLDGKDKSDFENEVGAMNLNSPFNLLGENGVVTPKIIALNFIGKDKVQATFRTTVIKGNEVRQYSYSLTADFVSNDFNDLTVADRWVNTFGIKFKNWNLTQNASNDALSINRPVATSPQTISPVATNITASEPVATTE